MKAIVLPINTTSLNELRRVQSQVIRRSFKASKDGKTLRDIEMDLMKTTKLHGHLFRSGAKRGADLCAASDALEAESIIFGSKKQFARRCKNLITKEEWKEAREQPLYSIGQANQKGNRNFRIDYETRSLTYKGEKGEVLFSFAIPKVKANYEVILEELSQKAKNKEMALTFSVSRNSVSIIFDETKLECFQKKYIKYKKGGNRYLGIDLNPNRIGIAIFDRGKIIYAENFEYTTQDKNKRRNETSHFCDAIYRLMKHYRITRLGMEDLSVEAKDHKKGKKFNGLVNGWDRASVLNKMKMICELTGCIFCNINPAYSSFIGAIRNPKLGDCAGAAAEIARRCAYQKGDFYPRDLISQENIVHRWKEMANISYSSWVELYKEMKNRDLGWRSPPCNSRSSKMGAWSERLLIHPLSDSD